jgi:hypothetical protein
VEQQIISLSDLDPHARLNTFDYVLHEDEMATCSGKCVGRRIELASISVQVAFRDRLRRQGQIWAPGLNGPDTRRLRASESLRYCPLAHQHGAGRLVVPE